MYVLDPNCIATGMSLSWLIDRVEFYFHESYEKLPRLINKEPFSECESGWGEFDIIIKIFFKAPEESPMTLRHYLRLFPVAKEAELTVDHDQLEYVVSEKYDELVYCDPSKELYESYKTEKINHKAATYKTEEEKEQIIKLKNALQKVEEQMRKYKEKAKRTEEELQMLEEGKNKVSQIKMESESQSAVTTQNTKEEKHKRKKSKK